MISREDAYRPYTVYILDQVITPLRSVEGLKGDLLTVFVGLVLLMLLSPLLLIEVIGFYGRLLKKGFSRDRD